MIRKISSWFGGPKRRWSRALEQFENALTDLRPEDIAIDCGANVGDYTVRMAATGAKVYAFEPNSHAFEVLQARIEGAPNVTLLRKAVAAKAGTVKLYFHRNAAVDPLKWSTGSSVLPTKGNIEPDSFEIVEAVSLPEFILGLNSFIALLKVDIEGAEIELLDSLLEFNLFDRIGKVFVELHDKKMPELVAPTSRIRATLKERNIRNVNLDWR